MDSGQSWLSPQVVWFILGFVLLLMEFATPGLITVFFGLGAWIVAMICWAFDIPVSLQLVLFLVISVALLGLLRSKLKDMVGARETPSQFEAETMNEFLGQKAVVTQAITANKRGKVEFRGTYWDAEAFENIAVGTSVEILDKSNITLTVRALEGDE